MIRKILSDMIRRIAMRFAILRQWPSLIMDVLLVGILMVWFFDGLQALLFGIWLVLFAGAPIISGLRSESPTRIEDKRHCNLFIQKFCPSGLVLLFSLQTLDVPKLEPLMMITFALFPSFLAALWVWSWWSPELDTRWAIPDWDRIKQDAEDQERSIKR